MSRDSLNINVFGEETYFNDDVTFFKNVNIGGNGILSDVTVDYTNRSPTCTLPITVTTPPASPGTRQINIPDNSNAFGAKYVQTTEPTGSSVCDGDIWYDTTAGGGDAVNYVLTGTIHMWGGSIASIPNGYQLCNGAAAATSELVAITGATVPDLRDRFVVGAGSAVGVGSTGGANEVILTTAQMPAHSHNVNNQTSDGPQWLAFSRTDINPTPPNNSTGYASAVGTGDDRIFSITNTGGGAAHENRPPYYALVYMIKT